MAYGKATKGNYVFVKLLGLGKDDPEPYFEIKNGDETTQGNYIEGYFVKADLGDYEWEGKKRDVFNIYLKDGEETIKFSCAFNTVSRSLLNSLASAGQLGKVHIKVYINAKGYKSVYVSNNGEMLKWKHDYDWMKSMITPITNPRTGEVEKNDYYDLDEVMKQIVLSLKRGDDNEVNAVLGDDDDEIPFNPEQ